MERSLGAQNFEGNGLLLVCVIVEFKFVCVIVDYDSLHSDDGCVLEIIGVFVCWGLMI